MHDLSLQERWKALTRRREFQSAPATALFRRLAWRVRWRLNERPWSLSLGTDLAIRVPRGGAGALIYYQGYSEPETARFVLDFLKPGMVFFDVGAHIGEYTLLASRRVGPQGQVHSFEPQPDTFDVLRDNVNVNSLGNVTLRNLAVSDRAEKTDFKVRADSSLSSLASQDAASERGVLRRIRVDATSLDRYSRESGSWPDLIKIDVEGAEPLVLHGAEELLAAPPGRAPTLVFEYGPENYRAFGYGFRDIQRLMGRTGYRMFPLATEGRPNTIAEGSEPPVGTRNVVASKAEPAAWFEASGGHFSEGADGRG